MSSDPALGVYVMKNRESFQDTLEDLFSIIKGGSLG